MYIQNFIRYSIRVFLPMRKKLLWIVTLDYDGTVEITIHILHSSDT